MPRMPGRKLIRCAREKIVSFALAAIFPEGVPCRVAAVVFEMTLGTPQYLPIAADFGGNVAAASVFYWVVTPQSFPRAS